jgi:hypothetical protein
MDCAPIGGITSSMNTGGGVLSLSLRRRVAITRARSKFAFRLRLDSAAYQATPCLGRPRIRGMTGALSRILMLVSVKELLKGGGIAKCSPCTEEITVRLLQH